MVSLGACHFCLSLNKLKRLYLDLQMHILLFHSVPFKNTFHSSQWKVDTNCLEIVSLSNIQNKHNPLKKPGNKTKPITPTEKHQGGG